MRKFSVCQCYKIISIGRLGSRRNRRGRVPISDEHVCQLSYLLFYCTFGLLVRKYLAHTYTANIASVHQQASYIAIDHGGSQSSIGSWHQSLSRPQVSVGHAAEHAGIRPDPGPFLPRHPARRVWRRGPYVRSPACSGEAH